jgi:multicomponent Na+:H+ antiporter subunit E
VPHALSLGLVLFVVWLLLSGIFEPLLLGLGVASSIVVVYIAHRMDVIDREGHPIHLTPRTLLYFPWLVWEIVKANFDVALAIVRPAMPIEPRLLHIKAGQKDDLGRVIYANSITLTPGTVTIATEGSAFTIHALTRGAAEGLESGDMDRRVTAMEDAKMDASDPGPAPSVEKEE